MQTLAIASPVLNYPEIVAAEPASEEPSALKKSLLTLIGRAGPPLHAHRER
jgi:hypothetical protein